MTTQSFMADDNNHLELPADTTVLDRRSYKLARFPWPSLADRVELRLLCQWRVERVIRPSDVMRALLLHSKLPTDLAREKPRHEALPPLYELQHELWQRLLVICDNGELQPPRLPSPDSGEYVERMSGQVNSWFDGFLPSLLNALNRGYLNSAVIAEAIPELRHQIGLEVANEWFSGVYTLGETLHRQADKLGEDAAIWLLDAVARALISAIGELRNGTLNIIQERRALGRVRLWWMLLKGFVYDSVMVESAIAARLARENEVLDRTVAALLRGSEVLGRHRGGVATPLWRFRDEDAARRFTSRELVEQLRQVVREATP